VKYQAIIKKKKPDAYNSVLDQIKPYNYTRPCILNSVLLLLAGGVCSAAGQFPRCILNCNGPCHHFFLPSGDPQLIGKTVSHGEGAAALGTSAHGCMHGQYLAQVACTAQPHSTGSDDRSAWA